MRRKTFYLLFTLFILSCGLGTPAATAVLPAPSIKAPSDALPTNSETASSPKIESISTAIEESATVASGFDPTPPVEIVKLIFIHHSSGENWLADWNGELGKALMENNYFVSDTNYEWGPTEPLLGGPIGSFTDTGNWWNWFLGPSSKVILQSLYSESGQHAEYSRLSDDPGGENEIIMFKSCFPNSALEGNPADPPVQGDNPLQGQDSGSGNQTVANAKRIYMDLLDYFVAKPDKLFIVITAPPLQASDTSPEQATNARAFNRWLVKEWLAAYPKANVAVFDFYNVLTSNGGSPEANDLDSAEGNHHRFRDGLIEYITDRGLNTSVYPTEDSHPSAAGNRKATGEFIPLLNIYYHHWNDAG